ncbi:MAG: hypothetical protein OHK0048_21670 [Rhodoferax sp.]
MTPQTTLPIARYRLHARVQAPLQLPLYAGSLLRGTFGAALRQLACMTRAPTCVGCPLRATCPYPRIFETPPPPPAANAPAADAPGSRRPQQFSALPNAYVIEPPTPGARTLQAGDALEFGIVLIGPALQQSALVLLALQRALARGLTAQRSPCALQAVDWIAPDGSAQRVWCAQSPRLLDHPAQLHWLVNAIESEVARADSSSATSQFSLRHLSSGSGSNAGSISLHLHTPLRLQHQGHALPASKLDARTLLIHLTRRVRLVAQYHAGITGLDAAAGAAIDAAATLQDDKALRWMDWTRYSSRQQQEMTLGGVLGRWTLHGTPDALAQIHPWLWLGQWLHVGKNATMGLGAYTLS